MKKNRKKTIKRARKQVYILGIRVDSTSKDRLLTAVESKISHNSKFYILTPNPELILASTKDNKLRDALNSGDFSVPDGIGLAQASRFLSLPLIGIKLLDIVISFFYGLAVGISTFVYQKWLIDSLNIIHGRRLFLDLVRLAHKNEWRIFFLGGLDDEAERAAKKLGAGFAPGPKLNKNGEPASEAEERVEAYSIRKIDEFRPDLLFVAFGNPKQEIWINKNLARLNTGGAMAVGGTFRYVSGYAKLPPAWLEKFELEWLWRIVTEPFRLGRTINAVVVFPFKVWMYRLSQKSV